MEIINLSAHFDGKPILLDEPYELEPNTKLIVTVIDTESEQRDGWPNLSVANLERAYGYDEPDYSLELVKEANPGYEGR